MGIPDHCEASSSSFNFLANFLASFAKGGICLKWGSNMSFTWSET